jgi:hypothetical protein
MGQLRGKNELKKNKKKIKNRQMALYSSLFEGSSPGFG